MPFVASILSVYLGSANIVSACRNKLLQRAEDSAIFIYQFQEDFHLSIFCKTFENLLFRSLSFSNFFHLIIVIIIIITIEQ